MLIKTQKQLHKTIQKINRLQFQLSRQTNQQRAARTRTLIQIGGLLVKSGITEKLGIKIGADLQKEETQKKKAYTLLGLLILQLSVPQKIDEVENAERLGKQFLFENKDDDTDKTMKELTDNLVTV
ncbi:MAG: hypothetical protein EBT45_05040 [Alphaproteobacteria bacterium]|nr:hypothetical protein [Alphaproteobacteria bacterium]